MKVKIIEERSRYELEEEVNRVLSQYLSSEIFDIKYTGNGNSSSYSVDYYSAMIIFK